MIVCAADSGSATGCRPVCDAAATREVTYTGDRGPYVTSLCDAHAATLAARVWPETLTSVTYL
jgi:hypothetical protein